MGGGQGGRCPPSVGNSENIWEVQNVISSMHVHDDIMGFECKFSSEKH